MQRLERLMNRVRPLFERDPVEEHPLFCLLRERRLSPSETKAVALEIFHVVDAFPRFLSAVLTQIPAWQTRMQLVENLFSEHGRGNPAEVHVVSYRRFLQQLGLSEESIDASEPGLIAVSYVRAMLDLCGRAPPAEALAALGVVEEIVARVSPVVARSVRTNAESQGQIDHFGVHAVLDLSHAAEIYSLVAKDFEGPQVVHIVRGLALGMLHHRRLYDELLDLHIRAELRAEWATYPRAVQVAARILRSEPRDPAMG